MADELPSPTNLSRQQREILELLQSGLQCGIWSYIIDTKSMQWTEPVYEIFGFPMGRFPGTYEAFLETVHPDDRAVVAKAFSDAQLPNSTGIITTEYRILLPSGSVRSIIQHVRAHRDPLTNVASRLSGIVKDQTDELRIREQQHVALEQYRVLSESAADAIFIIDREGTVQYVNRAAAAWLGYQYHQIVGKPARDFFEPATARRQAQSLQKVFTTGESILTDAENSVRGNVRFLSTRLSPIRNSEGIIVAVLGVARDLTEQRKATERVQTSERRFEAIMQNTDDVILLIDHTGRTFFASPQVEQTFGYTPREYIDHDQSLEDPWSDFPALERTHMSMEFEELLKKPNSKIQGTTHFKRKDGIVIPISYIWTNLLDDPSLHAVLVVLRDITPLFNVVSNLQEAEKIGRFGSYELDARLGRWTSSPGLNEIFGIGVDYDRTVEGWGALIHPDDRQMMMNYLRTEVIGHRKPFDREYRIIRNSDRQTRIVHGLGRLAIDSQGVVTRMLGIIQDVTETRASQGIQARAAELERINAIMTDRELQMVKLKERIQDLEGQLSQKR